MYRNLIVLAACAVGIVVGWAGTTYIARDNERKLTIAYLQRFEDISWNTLKGGGKYSSWEPHTSYLQVGLELWRQGYIDDSLYNNAAAIASMRLCEQARRDQHSDKAKKFCKWANDHLGQSSLGIEYSEFEKVIVGEDAGPFRLSSGE